MSSILTFPGCCFWTCETVTEKIIGFFPPRRRENVGQIKRWESAGSARGESWFCSLKSKAGSGEIVSRCWKLHKWSDDHWISSSAKWERNCEWQWTLSEEPRRLWTVCSSDFAVGFSLRHCYISSLSPASRWTWRPWDIGVVWERCPAGLVHTDSRLCVSLILDRQAITSQEV